MASEVDFGDDPLEVSVYVTDLVVEIVVEAPDHDRPPDKCRFALLNLLRERFAGAFEEATRRRADKGGAKVLRPVGADGRLHHAGWCGLNSKVSN